MDFQRLNRCKCQLAVAAALTAAAVVTVLTVTGPQNAGREAGETSPAAPRDPV